MREFIFGYLMVFLSLMSVAGVCIVLTLLFKGISKEFTPMIFAGIICAGATILTIGLIAIDKCS